MNMKLRHLLILLAVCVAGSYQLSLPDDPTYYAGVVEHSVAEGTPSEQTSIMSNAFRTIIESPDARDLDIIVFPEHILNSRETATFVPHGAQNVTPCYAPDYEVFLVELSCAARSRGVYVVLNVVEKELCANGAGAATLDPCPPATGVRYFNTNVVLDRRGRVVSRYRKTHLWRREYYSTSVLVEPDVAIFETDFGVTFGHFICFDMLFYDPAMRLIHEHNVSDIIYPTYWFSELPFLSAVQLQEGWAFGNDVNLLAADASNPSGRTTGSGIYAGRAGRLTASINEMPARLLLKAHVPKRRPGLPAYQLPAQLDPIFQPLLETPRYTKVATYRDYNVDIFTSTLLDADFVNISQQLCHGSAFCCDFHVQRQAFPGDASALQAYRYRLGVYLGNETTLIRVDRSEQAICALFACRDEEIQSCGYVFPEASRVGNKHHFTSIRIGGTFPAAPRGRRLIMPSTLDGLFMPVAVAHYNWSEAPAAAAHPQQAVRVDLELIRPRNDILTFAIWSNYYTELPSTHNMDHLQPNGGATVTVTVTAPPPAVAQTPAPVAGSATDLACTLSLVLVCLLFSSMGPGAAN
ncbi:LOW QUALITY PROTEIN: vanin-like protein 1 [Drosophila obscura]|uniref:LOW QUALITY PROTEIN: vanin-like protein 1 n=1 Tax=Drosophila obscura TaxID=7282 RepID=UPI001BB2311A|nr:LOW QUALITY PROTEIN: vanin-like protein 1 [Drosophila obscura]